MRILVVHHPDDRDHAATLAVRLLDEDVDVRLQSDPFTERTIAWIMDRSERDAQKQDLALGWEDR